MEKTSAYILPAWEVLFNLSSKSQGFLAWSWVKTSTALPGNGSINKISFNQSSPQSIYFPLFLKFLLEIRNYENSLPNQWNLNQKSLQHCTITFSELLSYEISTCVQIFLLVFIWINVNIHSQNYSFKVGSSFMYLTRCFKPFQYNILFFFSWLKGSVTTLGHVWSSTHIKIVSFLHQNNLISNHHVSKMDHEKPVLCSYANLHFHQIH